MSFFDLDLNKKTGNFIGSNNFPLVVDASGRFLRDSTATPWRLKIDAAWLMGCHGSVVDQNTYLSSIKALGYNGFVLMDIVHAGGGAWTDIHEPNDAANIAPFTTANDFSTANPAYFAKVSDLIDRANAQALTVHVFHSYLGFNGGNQGWQAAIAAQTNTVCFNWGVFLGNTFTQPNIVWMHGGDNNPSGTALARLQQFILGIQSVTRNRLAGSEWQGNSSLVTDQAGFTYGKDPATSDMQIDWFYGWSTTQYSTADAAWANTTTLPAVLGEPPYYSQPLGGASSREQTRRAQHWAFTAGAIAGSNSGTQARWDWTPASWTATLTDVATSDRSFQHALYDSLSWWLMRPSGTAAGYCGRTLIVSGIGSGTAFITSCMSSDGNQLLAYVPPTGTGTTTFSVDFRSMSGTATTYWWNPTTGVLGSAIGTFANTLSSQSFTTPGDNGTSQNDWMLVGKVPS